MRTSNGFASWIGRAGRGDALGVSDAAGAGAGRLVTGRHRANRGSDDRQRQGVHRRRGRHHRGGRSRARQHHRARRHDRRDGRRCAAPSTRVIDARGGSVVPGFNDSHVHFVSGGVRRSATSTWPGSRRFGEVQAAISAFAAAQSGRRLAARAAAGCTRRSPAASPTRAQLDEVVPDRPAVMNCYDGHSIWVNSKALALAGITRDTPNPPNGEIVKDPRTGEPTGHLKESAADLVDKVLPHADRCRPARRAQGGGRRTPTSSASPASRTPAPAWRRWPCSRPRDATAT